MLQKQKLQDSTNRRKFFEEFAKEHNFDPLIPENWHLQSSKFLDTKVFPFSFYYCYYFYNSYFSYFFLFLLLLFLFLFHFLFCVAVCQECFAASWLKYVQGIAGSLS
jgi:hypothetical protein